MSRPILDLSDLQTIVSAIDSHLRVLQDSQDAYRKGNNPEGAEAVRKEWHRVFGVRERVNAAIRQKLAGKEAR